ADRNPTARRESADDASYQFVEAPLERGVLGDAGARWNRNQNQRDLSAILRMQFQETLEAEQTLLDPLGVVEAVDAQHHDRCAQTLVDSAGARANPRSHRNVAKVVDRDAQRKRADFGDGGVVKDHSVGAIDAKAEDALAGVDKMLDVH